MINFRLPNITAQDDRGKLEQIRTYLYQMSQELNWALGNIEKQSTEVAQKVEASTKSKNEAEKAQATFSEVKALIIKSADIVNAYYDQISYKLEGIYVAQSDFGVYAQETSAELKANSESISILFDNQQAINSALVTSEDGTTIIGSEAWCKIGVLGYEDSGFPIYGMEIGQNNEQSGETVYKKYAQYRSDGVHLFDQNGIEVATISDYTLKITNAEIGSATITSSLKLGGYIISTDNGLAFKWGGR